MSKATLPPPRRQGGNLEGLKTGKKAVERAATSQIFTSTWIGKREWKATNSWRTGTHPIGRCVSIAKEAYCPHPRGDQLHPCRLDQLSQPVDHRHEEPEDDDEAAWG